MSDHAVLTPEAHGGLRIRTERAAALGDDVMMALAVPVEFRRLQRHYPILFRLDLDRRHFNAVALFGFEAGENLFLEGASWDAGYRPLSIDIQPFLIGRRPGADDAQVHIDLDHPRVSTTGAGVRLFDEDGRPSPLLERVADQLGTLDQGARDAEAFCATLVAHELLEPLTLDIRLDDGSENRLVGFHGVDEERLRGLGADALGSLHAAGHLMPLFMAVASLGNFADLIARKNRRGRGG